MKKFIVLITMLLIVSAQPANATRAGQYCKTSDALKIAKASNKSTVQCIKSGTGNRYRWVVVK
jgi:hypothetical protein